MTDSATLFLSPGMARNRARNRVLVLEELRRLLPGLEAIHSPLPFGLPELDFHLPHGGLAAGALHEIVPETDGAMESAMAAAFGFVVAVLARISSPHSWISPAPSGPRLRAPDCMFAGEGLRAGVGGGNTSVDAVLPRLPRARPLIFILPTHGRCRYGRLSGHGLNSLGLDPSHVVLVETVHHKETLWAFAEALHSGVPLAVAGFIDWLDLKTSQKLQLAAGDANLPLFLIRPAPTLEASAAATRWRVGTAEAARGRFGLFARPRWHLQLERCRNGRPGEWIVEYDHVAHCFSLAAALADPALSRRAGARQSGHPVRHAHRS
jgi:protein ImuA